MPLAEDEFGLRFAVGLLGATVAAHLFLGMVLAAGERVAPAGVIVVVTIGLLPYLVLVALTWVIRSRRILLGTTILLVAVELLCVATLLDPRTSTGALGVIAYPVLAFLVILPLATALGLIRLYRLRRATSQPHGHEEEGEERGEER